MEGVRGKGEGELAECSTEETIQCICKWTNKKSMVEKYCTR